MIRLLLLLDKRKSIGVTLFNDKTIDLPSELLISLVQALLLLSEQMELGEAKGALREAELGKFQIAILTKDYLGYVVVQDIYDSEPFTHRILTSIIDRFHKEFLEENLNRGVRNFAYVKEEVARLLKTMKFERSLLPEIAPFVDSFHAETGGISDTLMLSDLDDGIITVWNEPKKGNIIKLLMEILSEIPFERQWLGESKLREPRHIGEHFANSEVWFIHRLGLTDFCLMGRAYYTPDYDRTRLENAIETFSDLILSLLLDSGYITSEDV